MIKAVQAKTTHNPEGYNTEKQAALLSLHLACLLKGPPVPPSPAPAFHTQKGLPGCVPLRTGQPRDLGPQLSLYLTVLCPRNEAVEVLPHWICSVTPSRQRSARNKHSEKEANVISFPTPPTIYCSLGSVVLFPHQ